VKQDVSLATLSGKRLAVDAHGELYQFLALIRLRDGSPLKDSTGRITSHLSGLFYRTTRLIADHAMELVYVFDGKPPALKSEEIERRRVIKQRYEQEHAEAVKAGDFAKAYSKATMTSRLTTAMAEEARELLTLMGLPVIEAPSEGEAQAAFMASSEHVWAAASKDYDALLFGAPRLLRFLTISGKEFLPSKGTFRPIVPEIIEAQQMLDQYGITREQLVDVAMLIGTDFNSGVKGIGPKKALKLVQQYGAIHKMPDSIQMEMAPLLDSVRETFLHPQVTEAYSIQFREPDVDGILRFLCEDRIFSRDRVEAALQRAYKQLKLSSARDDSDIA
jgi:flap endonuclease-1